MYDLNIIRRLNAASMALEIPALRTSGRWVVVIYNGLHYAEHFDFATFLEAEQEIETRERANSYDRLQLLAPLDPVAPTPEATSPIPDPVLQESAAVTPVIDSAATTENPVASEVQTAAA